MSDEAAENKDIQKNTFTRDKWPDEIIKQIGDISSGSDRLKQFSDQIENIQIALEEAVRLIRVHQEAEFALFRAGEQLAMAMELSDKEFRRIDDPMKSVFFKIKFSLENLHNETSKQYDEFFKARLAARENLTR